MFQKVFIISSYWTGLAATGLLSLGLKTAWLVDNKILLNPPRLLSIDLFPRAKVMLGLFLITEIKKQKTFVKPFLSQLCVHECKQVIIFLQLVIFQVLF